MEKNMVLKGDSAEILKTIPKGNIDLIVTDPPYLVNYRDKSGRSLKNDDNPDGVLPVFEPMAKAMRKNSYAICFTGWSALPQFSLAWEKANLRIVGQIVWHKNYASRQGYTQYRHETAYVLAKGNPVKPLRPLPSVLNWTYSGNKNHPTEKAIEVITPLIRCFSKPGDLVCDPFSGAGSTCVAAALNGRNYLGIDIDEQHCRTARTRLSGVHRFLSQKAAA